MNLAERHRRQAEACGRLRQAGQLERARRWLLKNRPRHWWLGTPLEWAEWEMPKHDFNS